MKTIEERYQKLSDVEHVLKRPGMYIGSTTPRTEMVSILDEDESQFVPREVTYNPAFLKIFDEIVSNSADEHRRNPNLNVIKVSVDSSLGRITVWDNGGIPVVMHRGHGEWVPEMIFSNLKAGSNFDDKEARLVAGTNGVGSTLTNIYSTEFTVRTCDGSNSYSQTFRDNLSVRETAVVTLSKGEPGFTEVSFVPDLPRFEMSQIDEDTLLMMRKRCVDIAAANPGVEVHFNGSVYKFPSFQEYCKLHTPELVVYAEDPSGRWKVGIAPATSGAFQQRSFVNSVDTIDGGTHVESVMNQISSWIRARIERKHKVDVKPSELRGHFWLFVQATIENPSFSSQTKEKLITDQKNFGSRFEMSEKDLKTIFESEIIQRVLDWANQKKLAEERRELRDLNKKAQKAKITKLIDARASSGRSQCDLALFEGDSASSAFRMFRDPMYQGAFPLRGKFLNVTDMPNTKVIKNAEVQALVAALGLQLGEEPKNLRYGRILIYADADPDGDSITGLLVNFFARYWPELFAKECIFRVMTPLVVATKGKVKKIFYSQDEFDSWLSGSSDLKSWDISYKKGLAALESAEYLEIIKRPKLFALLPGSNMTETLRYWFGKDPTYRKARILRVEEESIENEEIVDEEGDDSQ